MIKKIPFTQAGYQLLVDEQTTITSQRIQAILELQRSRELGDLSENSAYRVARQKLSRIDRRIKYLKNLIKQAYITHPKSKDKIEIGSCFSLSLHNQTSTYTIVNTFESDIDKGLLSTYSPIGKSVLGKKKGDIITVKTPKGISTFTITEIK